MDGLWSDGINIESTQQGALSKHRLLRVNLSSTGLMQNGDASSRAGENPASSGFVDIGPHFIMSADTPDESHSFGFECAFETNGIGPVVATAPYTITVWELLGTTIVPDQAASRIPIWASMAPVVGINDNELFHSFDVNATALRFQIVDAQAAIDASVSRSILIAYCEL